MINLTPQIAMLAVIVINCIISFKAFNDPTFMDKYLFRIGDIQRGEQYRFFTSGFLHVDVRHLAFNMITLYFFAPAVINELNSIQFIIIYVVSLFAGNLLSYLFHKDEYAYSAVGASGAVSGIIYAAILLRPEMKIYFGIPGWLFGMGYLLYSIYGMKTRRDNIGHDAHFGGAVAGFAVTLVYLPNLIFAEPLIVGALIVPVVILIVLRQLGKI
jgi:membrane associated rhomboid family serine protease